MSTDRFKAVPLFQLFLCLSVDSYVAFVLSLFLVSPSFRASV